MTATLLAATVAFAAFGDSLGNIGDVRLKGWLGERLDAMIEKHVAARDVDYITAPFMEKTETKGWWQTEFWGKWMHSAVPYAKLELESGVGERLKSNVERSIERILASQEPGGYIGNYPNELRCGEGWDVWGMKYTMMGLLHYYDFAQEQEIVVANSRSRRKDGEEVVVNSCSRRENGDNSTLQLQLPTTIQLLQAAVMTAEDIVKEEVNLAGGCASSEAWFHGAKKQHLPYVHLQETCVTTTWMRFCEKLLEVTDDPKWADQIERTFYNAYLGALRSDGGEFAAYTPLTGNRWHGMNHCFMHTDCCTANGPRGFLCFLKELFTTRGDAVTFNFYSSALVKGELSGGRKVAFDMYSLYPRTDFARIVSHTEGAVPVRLRIPAWSAKTEVKLNGETLEDVAAGSYFTIDRDWKLGDIVEVKFDMPVVAHTLDHHVAFTRGPVLLARDSRFADGDLTEPLRHGIKDGQILPTFAAVRTPSDDIWMAFSATLPIGSHTENPEASNPSTVFFCDYASAGNTWTRANFYRTWFPVEYGNNE